MAKVEFLSLPFQTMYAELVEKAWTGGTADLTARGGSSYSRKAPDGRSYLYWQPPTRDGVRPAAEYIGLDSEENQKRIAAKQDTVEAKRQRRDMVRALRGTRLPAPDKIAGDTLAALAEAGVFRLRAVVVGSIAFMSYAGLLGVRIPASLARTSDLDIAQFHSVAIGVEDEIAHSLLDVLKSVDSAFAAVPTDSRRTMRYALRKGGQEVYSVDILCPLQGPERESITRLKALKADAQMLRYLDLILYHEINAVALHGAGIPINVPAPERYALHKILVSALRHGHPASQAKAIKDVDQATALIQILNEVRPDDLQDAWAELLDRGPSWRANAAAGLARIPKRIGRNARDILLAMTPAKHLATIAGKSAGARKGN
jgi:hypothetical protein